MNTLYYQTGSIFQLKRSKFLKSSSIYAVELKCLVYFLLVQYFIEYIWILTQGMYNSIIINC